MIMIMLMIMDRYRRDPPRPVLYIYIYICYIVCIYIYTYFSLSLSLCIYIYIYINVDRIDGPPRGGVRRSLQGPDFGKLISKPRKAPLATTHRFKDLPRLDRNFRSRGKSQICPDSIEISGVEENPRSAQTRSKLLESRNIHRID